MAPAEGNVPTGVLMDEDAEALSFPKIYCGKQRKFHQRITYGKIIKSDFKRYDRRCANNVTKLLYSYKKLQIQQVVNQVSIAMRQRKNICNTAKNVTSNENLEQLLDDNHGYRILKQIRGSPSYWKQVRSEMVAMVRQLGKPSLFGSFSAAESEWLELIIILYKNNNKKDLNFEEAKNLSFNDKAELIRKDPITCAQYFDHRINKLIKEFINKKNGPFKKYQVVDFDFRVEFQHRGSPHIHIIIWLLDAPIYHELKDNSDVIEFIDSIITCNADHPLIKYQTHNHTHTCNKRKINNHKNNKSFTCRFNIPYPIMNRTMILQPLGDDSNDQIKKVALNNYEKIKQKLNSLKDFKGLVTYENFLAELYLNENEYLLAIRSSIMRVTVFLKRESNEIFINGYNKDILDVHKANMDLQYVLDPHACIAYMVNYINKSNRGQSDLIRAAIEESNNGNLTLRQKLSLIGNSFLNSTEVSAQEAAYIILG
jgi:hypothetical protein